jgi:transposase
VWLKATLVEAAHGASRKKGSYLKGKYHRVASKHGKKRAAVAVAHKILIAAYHIIRDKEEYQDLGEDYLEQIRRTSLKRYWVQRLEKLGFNVVVEDAESQKAA